ncbi:MAG: hypothetical protein CMH52_01425 [Myxococcales bacterium]|nr:hypothetical protein [Myxococcales bacterium]
MIKLVMAVALTLCAGCGVGLNELERQEYDELTDREESLKAQKVQFQTAELKSFNELSRLERRMKRISKGVSSCQVNLKGRAIGPLPFRFKKGYRVGFKRLNSKAAEGCQNWLLKVAR